MARRVFLPLTDRLLDPGAKPTLDAMRARLGGRVEAANETETDRPLSVGDPVVFGGDDRGASDARVGLLLAMDATSADVYLTRGMVKRTLLELIAKHDGSLPAELVDIQPSIARLGRLRAPQHVWFERANGEIGEGTLVEKCRYGALVEQADRVVVGVGFRKLFDVPPEAKSPTNSGLN